MLSWLMLSRLDLLTERVNVAGVSPRTYPENGPASRRAAQASGLCYPIRLFGRAPYGYLKRKNLLPLPIETVTVYRPLITITGSGVGVQNAGPAGMKGTSSSL